MALTLDDFYTWVDSQSLKIRGKKLTEVERCILHGSIKGLSYEALAADSRFEKAYLQNTAGPGLWRFLQQILGEEYRIGKPYIKDVVEELIDTVGVLPGDDRVWNAGRSQSNIDYLPSTEKLYGRSSELKKLLMRTQDSRCIVITGQVGIGKSSLAAKLIDLVSRSDDYEFDYYIWKSIYHGPHLEDLYQNIIQDINQDSKDRDKDYSSDEFIRFLKVNRCFLILDEADSILKGDNINPYGEKYIGYGYLLRRVVEESHNSVVVLTSRENFKDLDELSQAKKPVTTFHLTGLSASESLEIYEEYALQGRDDWLKITDQYRGNPLALHNIADRIKDFFDGKISRFIEYETIWLGSSFPSRFDQQFGIGGRLSLLEMQILVLMAQQLEIDESITLDSLITHIIDEQQFSTSKSQILEALNSLTERSVIEKEFTAKALEFRMPPVIRKYLLTDPSGAVKARISQKV